MEDKEMEEEVVVEFTDEDGNVFSYVQELIIPVGNDKFALLVGVEDGEDDDDHERCACCDDEEDEEDVIVAKIVVDENGEETYIEPTDEEYEAVQAAYDAMFEDEDEE